MTKILFALLLCACGGKLPETRYYQLAAAPSAPAAHQGDLIVLETPTTDQAYDDDRIVYRTTPYRLDYYQYQRWSSPPGVMIGNYLEQALEASGQFRGVVRELTPDAPVVLSGRVIAIEEVDRSKTDWAGRIVLELILSDAKTNEALWTQQFTELEPLRQQTPEGLAAALSTAMARIAARTVPEVARAAKIAATRARPQANPAVGSAGTASSPTIATWHDRAASSSPASPSSR